MFINHGINHVINHLQSLRFIELGLHNGMMKTRPPICGRLVGMVYFWVYKKEIELESILLSRNYVYIFFFSSWGTKLLSCIYLYIYIYMYINIYMYIIYILCIYIYVYYTYFNRIVFPLPPTCPWWTPFEPLIPWPTEHRNDGHQRRAWAEANEAPAQAEAAGTSKVRWKWWFTGDLPIENGDFP